MMKNRLSLGFIVLSSTDDLVAAVGLIALLLTCWPTVGRANEGLGDLSGPWQLVVDDYGLASKNGLVRTYHPLVKFAGNPVLSADQPWEGQAVYTYGTVLPDETGNGYRLWYSCIDYFHDCEMRVLYATSPDGIHWSKPALGIRQWNGSTANNMFFPRATLNGIASIIHTPWDPDPGRRYHVVNYDPGGYFAAWSADGIHLTDAPTNPVLTQAGDVGQFNWDPHTQQYRGYVKLNPYVSGLLRRAVGLTTTDNIQTWPTPRLILAPDDFDDRWVPPGTVQRTHFYGMSAFAYESMYLGFLWIFRATEADGYLVGPVYVELVSSHDGVHWFREEGDRPALLELGPSGAWDAGQLYTTIAPLVVGDTIKVYYGGCDDQHGLALKDMFCSVGLATIRKDGFVSLDAGGAPGSVTTKRLLGADGPLQVNYQATGGWLAVEVLDENGGVVPGYGAANCDLLTGDSIAQTVTWGSHGELPGGVSPLRLRFVMQNASLFSFMAGQELQVMPESSGPLLSALYTLERCWSTTVTDTLLEDGAQTVSVQGDVRVDGFAAFGRRSVLFDPPGTSANTLTISGTAELGTRFTLAAMVDTTEYRLTRLFSSHSGAGAFKTGELVFDFDPRGVTIPGLRLVCKGIAVTSSTLDFADDGYHHLAATYDDGNVILYLDGVQVGQGFVPGGAPVNMVRDLLVGEDATLGTNQQLVGRVDDLLVLGRVLTPQEVLALKQTGAAAFFGLREVPSDLDQDGDVDQEDFGLAQRCLSGTSVPVSEPDCEQANFDGDADVDQNDLAILLDCMSGAGILAEPGCGE